MLRRRHVLIATAAAAVAAPAVIAPAASAERLVAADASNRLYTFDSASPEKWSRTKALTGLAAGEKVVGLDVRPAGRRLIALTNRSRLYSVQRSRAIATPIGGNPFMPALDGAAVGFDFNPTVDRIRVVSGSGQNLRLNPDTGAVAFTDGGLRYKDGDPAAGSTPSAIGAAYTNSVAGAMSTTLYVIDTRRDSLAIQAPPNDGVLTTVGPLGVNLSGPLASTSPRRTARRTCWPIGRAPIARGCLRSTSPRGPPASSGPCAGPLTSWRSRRSPSRRRRDGVANGSCPPRLIRHTRRWRGSGSTSRGPQGCLVAGVTAGNRLQAPLPAAPASAATRRPWGRRRRAARGAYRSKSNFLRTT